MSCKYETRDSSGTLFHVSHTTTLGVVETGGVRGGKKASSPSDRRERACHRSVTGGGCELFDASLDYRHFFLPIEHAVVFFEMVVDAPHAGFCLVNCVCPGFRHLELGLLGGFWFRRLFLGCWRLEKTDEGRFFCFLGNGFFLGHLFPCFLQIPRQLIP